MRNKVLLKPWLLAISLFFARALSAQAQAPAPAASGLTLEEDRHDRGFTLYESFEGSSNTDGQVMDLTSTAGYIFNKHFSADLGIPMFFVRGTSSTSTGTTTTVSNNGIGDVATGLHLKFNNPVVRYASTLSISLPSGDTSKGRSTGRITFDWGNDFSREFGRWAPFANLGVGNSLYNTHYFQLPFLTLGKVAHFEAGTSFDLGHSFSVGGSAYDVAPWGQQKVFSRLVTKASPKAVGKGQHGRAFENNPETTGGADLVRDNGFNAALDFSPSKFLDFELAFSRSVHYDLNTVSFGVGFNLSPLFRKAGR